MTDARASVLAELVEIAAGEFAMGSDRHYPEEGPVRTVAVGAFI